MNGLKLSVPGVNIRVIRTADSDIDIPLPRYATKGAAGMDVYANFGSNKRGRGVTLMPSGRALIPTGLNIEIPRGFEMQIRPRSGLALRHGVTVANAPGTIDSDYRGEIGVILVNLGHNTFDVSHGDRIAQLVLAPVTQVSWVETTKLSKTERGSGGFGSTGHADIE